MRLVNVDQFINELSIDLGFDVPKLKPVIKRWVYEAVSNMGIAYLNLKSKKYTNLSYSLEKPDDFIKADHIFYVASDGGCVEPFTSPSICCASTDIWNMVKNGYYALGKGSNKWTIDETLTHFVLDPDASTEFSQVLLLYWAAPIDDEGNPMVPEIAKAAVFAHCKWKYLIRERGRVMTAAGRNPIALSEIDWWHKKYEAEYRNVIGRMNSVNPRQLKEIGEYVMFGVSNAFPPLLDNAWRERVCGC